MINEEMQTGNLPEFVNKIENISANNILREKDDFIKRAIVAGLYTSTDDANLAIQKESTAIKENHAITINMSSESIIRLIKAGKIEHFWNHFEEVGDLEKIHGTNNRSLDVDYPRRRRIVEKKLRSFLHLGTSEHPIYGALASYGYDMVEGASPEYGNWNIVIESFGIEKKTVFSNRDSFLAIETDGSVSNNNFFDINDACTMKAIRLHDKDLRLDDPKRPWRLSRRNKNDADYYIEAAMFGDIKIDDIKMIICNLHNMSEVELFLKIVPQFLKIKDKLYISFDDEISTLEIENQTKTYNEAKDHPIWSKYVVPPETAIPFDIKKQILQNFKVVGAEK